MINPRPFLQWPLGPTSKANPTDLFKLVTRFKQWRLERSEERIEKDRQNLLTHVTAIFSGDRLRHNPALINIIEY